MTKRKKRILGQIIKVASLIIGIYLIIITFGIKPIIAIGEICRTSIGLESIIKILLQGLKMLFGGGETFLGMVILYRCGVYLVSENKE